MIVVLERWLRNILKLSVRTAPASCAFVSFSEISEFVHGCSIQRLCHAEQLVRHALTHGSWSGSQKLNPGHRCPQNVKHFLLRCAISRLHTLHVLPLHSRRR